MNADSFWSVLSDGKACKKVHIKVKPQSVELLPGILQDIGNRHDPDGIMAGSELQAVAVFHQNPAPSVT